MSNLAQVKRDVTTYIQSRVPLIVIQTNERERVASMLYQIADEEHTEMVYFAKIGSKMLPSQRPISFEIDAIEHAITSMRKNPNQVFVFSDARHIDSDNAYSRDLLNLTYLAQMQHCSIILVTGDMVWSKLMNLGLVSLLDLPNEEERIKQIQAFIKMYKGAYHIEWNDEDVLIASHILKGFSEIQINNVLSSELVGRDGLLKNRIYKMAEQKSHIYGHLPNLGYINISDELELYGLDSLKSWLDEKRKVFFAKDEDLAYYDLTYPKGLLLTGVPGCGKSLTAKIVAKRWNLPLFRFDMDTIYDKWAGESERKMKDALAHIDHLAPCVIWVDEIEKSLASMEGTSDIGKRIVGQFLFWLQESKSRVFLIATANNIHKLPPELFRKGRFSEIFFIDLPNRLERKEAIQNYLNKSLRYKPQSDELEKLIDETEGFSYADIEMSIKWVAEKCLIDDTYKLTFDEIVRHMQSVVSITDLNPEMIDKLRTWGVERAAQASCKEE